MFFTQGKPMSIQLIQKYYADVDKIIRYRGSRNESSLRKPFQDLLEQYARGRNLMLMAEVAGISAGNLFRAGVDFGKI